MPVREPEERGSGAECHDDFFQRRVARALADTIDGDLGLARALLQTGQGVGHGQPRSLWQCTDMTTSSMSFTCFESGYQLGIFLRCGVSHGVRNVQRGRASLDGCLQYFGREFELGATAVFGTELDVGTQ